MPFLYGSHYNVQIYIAGGDVIHSVINIGAIWLLLKLVPGTSISVAVAFLFNTVSTCTCLCLCGRK